MKRISHSGFQAKDILFHGNRYLIANGYFGYRGTLEEYTKDSLVQFNLNGIYDRVGEAWRESINAFNPMYTYIEVKGVRLDVRTMKPSAHEQALEMKVGLHQRSTAFKVGTASIKIESERFADQNNLHNLACSYSFSSTADIELDLFCGIDCDVFDTSGKHLEDVVTTEDGEIFTAFGRTQELHLPVAVSQRLWTSFRNKPETIEEDGKILHHYTIKMNPNRVYTVNIFSSVVHTDENCVDITKQDVNEQYDKEYARCYRETRWKWEAMWDIANVDVTGDKDADLAIKNAIYHLLSIRPYSNKVSIPARGLSGQTYKGAVFWDTEIFMLPFYLNTDLESAKRIIEYRINSLQGAKEKAKHYGYEGAFYAWESQENGYDATSEFNMTDPETNEPIRTYFKEKQIHISAAIAYALNNYLRRTNDMALLFEGGFEMLLQIGLFYATYATLNPTTKLYEFHGVIGPDEYHERVNNNAYTNYMVKFTVEALFDWLKEMRTIDYPFVREYLKQGTRKDDLEKVRLLKNSLYVPKPNRDGVIEQFDGYFKLEDISLKTLQKRITKEHEYLGGEHGIASRTQIIKQADVVTMLVLLSDQFDERIKKANFDYYLPRTEHGSSLSASMYGMLACEINEVEKAYAYYMQSAKIDLEDTAKSYAGGIYIGGTHPASSGGAYMTLIYGIAKLVHQGNLLSADYDLPESINAIRFCVNHVGRIANVRTANTKVEITWRGEKTEENEELQSGDL